jgi:hypothetical protein
MKQTFGMSSFLGPFWWLNTFFDVGTVCRTVTSVEMGFGLVT